MTVAIPLAKQGDYRELMYCLRSIEKNLPPCDVIIMGDFIPDWLTNVTVIQVPDIPGRKQYSIKTKIMAALEYTDEIFFTNDDIYVLKPVNPETYPYYYSGVLKTVRESGTKPLEDTLKAMRKPVKHFDVHYPIVYRKDFKEAVEAFPAETIIKSMYGNYLGIDGVEIPDCKVLREMTPEMVRRYVKDKGCMSTGTHLKSALVVLQEYFPKPSKYEIV